ncbi:MAG: radical SAM protein, partial [Nitrospinota bacterium]
MKTFSDNLKRLSISLERKGVESLQINVGKLCNQSCVHCHVDAGPDRHEIMARDTIDRVISFIEKSSIKAIDITGGA